MKTVNSIKHTFKTFQHISICLHKRGRLYITAKAITAVVNVLLGLPFILIPGMIINELTGDKKLADILCLVLVIIVVPLIGRVFNTKWNQFTIKKEQELRLSLLSEFYAHTADIEYAEFENPDFLDLRERVRGIYAEKIINVVGQVSSLFSALLSLLAIFSIIMTLNPLMIAVIVVSIFINSQITKWLKQKQYDNDKRVTALRRKLTAAAILEKPYDLLEVKLFGLKNYFIDQFVEGQTEADAIRGELDSDRVKATVGYQTTGVVQQGILYGYLIYRVVATGLTVGSMTIYLSAISQFSGALNSLVNSYLNLSSNNLWIEDFIQYNTMARVENKGNLTPVFDENSVIEFRDVSFKYPGSDRCVLDKLNLTIHGNEKLSIVGHNGSGKTTFIKLLTRFYEPTEGEILLNGVNIQKYDYEKYQRIFAPVFQDCSLFYFSLAENIVLDEKFDEEKLRKLGQESGLDTLVEKLPKGYDTQLFKRYDETGIDPSGGEEQKIAIARACYRGGEMFLLDEPTAALDPLSEYRIYTQFNNMIEDKAAIIITHRLSAVKLADRIAVFDNGRVIEYGTHRELYEKNGIYTEMYDKQAEFYLKESVANEE